MNREAVISRVTEVFARLESYLKLKGRQNLNDAAVLAEDFCKELLNRLYGHSLINLNTLDPNAAATDLIDTTQRLGFQITANATPKKIRDVHRKATTHDLASRLDQLIILFLVAKAPTEPEPSGNFTPCLSPPIVSRDLSDLISDIREMDLPRQQEIADFLEQEWGRPSQPWHQDTRISNLPFDSLGDLFIGRDAFMGDLAKSLGHAGPTVIKSVQAIHGMGGVGKTRAAIEYAWRHAAEFHALLFVQADSPDALRRNLAALCAPAILNLPEQAASETETQVAAVLAWLRKTPGWLLILDNVDSPETQTAVKEITTPLLHGQLLITSRLAQWGTGFDALDLDVLSPEDSVKLLLHHTAGLRIEEPDEAITAAEIARLVDGLALALEQAAAHIRKTRCSFAAYLVKWHAADTRLRDYQDRGVDDYPRSLWVTFDASFHLLAPEARHLLQLLSWLAPDPMPVAHLETLAAIPTATDVLCDLDDLHLVRRSDANRAFAVHRLIQEIVRREQTEPQPPPLLEALEWVDDLHPNDPNDASTWSLSALLTPHAIQVAAFGADRSISELSAQLFNKVGVYYINLRADNGAAESLMRRALDILERSLGEYHPDVAAIVSNLAQLLQGNNRLAEAEPLIRRALAIWEGNISENRQNIATSLNNLAQLLIANYSMTEAELLLIRAVEICENKGGEPLSSLSATLNNLAQLLHSTNRMDDAEQLIRRALAIDETSFGQDHPLVGIRLNNLATLLYDHNRLEEAEPLMRRMVEIFLKFTAATGHPHPHLRAALGNHAALLRKMGRSDEEIGATLADLERIHGVDLSGAGGREKNELSARLHTVLEEIMKEPTKAAEVAARLQHEDPALLQELIAFIQSQQD